MLHKIEIITKWINEFTEILASFYSVYVDMGLASNAPIMLTSVTSGASFSRSFSIKVTQIDCYSLSKGKELLKMWLMNLLHFYTFWNFHKKSNNVLSISAADGCLQYFTGVSGQMRSFNYNDAAGLQLSNTDYTMCVRTERNFCGIQYTACPDTGYKHSIISFIWIIHSIQHSMNYAICTW